MHRRNAIFILGSCLLTPATLLAGHPPRPPQRPIPSRGASHKCCSKCNHKSNRRCRCECSSRCGNSGRPSHNRHSGSSQNNHSHDRGNGHARPHTPSRGRGHGPQHDTRPSSGFSSIVSKFDKNRDGKLDEKERAEARKYFVSRYRR